MPKAAADSDKPTTLLLSEVSKRQCKKLRKYSSVHRSRAAIIRALIQLGHQHLEFELAVPGRQLYLVALDPAPEGDGRIEAARQSVSFRL